MGNIATFINELGGKTQPLLEAIDSVRNLEEEVWQPQIVVVGDRSSGKSSVLQHISGLPFDGVSTRLATEIIVRKSTERSVKISVRSFTGNSRAKLEATRKFRSFGELYNIVFEETLWMRTHSDSAWKVPKDIFCLHIEDPDLQNLTLVDLPGLLPLHDTGQPWGDTATVRQLARRFMQQERSIILSVVAANTPNRIQTTLDECKVYDPEMTRTVAVITKPDLADFKFAGASVTVVAQNNLFNNYSIPSARFGYTQVLWTRGDHKSNNLGESTGSIGEPHPYLLRRENIEPVALREKLSNMLWGHAQTQLSKLVSEIELNLGLKRASLYRLGTPSESFENKKARLVGNAVDFQRLARDAVNGSYGDEFFGAFGDTSCKLRAKIRNYNHAFSTVMSRRGSSRIILREDSALEREMSSSVKELEPGTGGTSHLEPFVAHYNFRDPEVVSRKDLIDELKALSAAHQGTTGSFDAPDKKLAAHLFQQQIHPCEAIAKHHVRLVADISRDFIGRLADRVFTPEECARFLVSYVDPFFEETRNLLSDKVEELFRPYARGHTLPIETRIMVNRDRWHNAGWAEQTIDLMEAYYEVFLATFTENVINLAVESCLVRELEHIFTPEMVHRMNGDDLMELATGLEHHILERKDLEEEVQKLEDSLEVCRKHMPEDMLAAEAAETEGRPAGPPPTTPTGIKALPAAATAPQSMTPDPAGTSASQECRSESGAKARVSTPAGQTTELKPGGLFSSNAKTLSSLLFPRSSPVDSTKERGSGCESSGSVLKSGTKGPELNTRFSGLSLGGGDGKSISGSLFPTSAESAKETKAPAGSSSASPSAQSQSTPPNLASAPKSDSTSGSKQTLKFGEGGVEEKGTVKWYPLDSSRIAWSAFQTRCWLRGGEPTEFQKTSDRHGYDCTTAVYDHISASRFPRTYQGYSPEELRLSHYKGEPICPHTSSDPDS